jgi:hypothetical protein
MRHPERGARISPRLVADLEGPEIECIARLLFPGKQPMGDAGLEPATSALSRRRSPS